MRIVVAHHNPVSCERWRNALAEALPDAEVLIWNDGETREADYAIAWTAPPLSFFERQPRLTAFFSTGAGVEKLLDSGHMPADLPVIRLEDAGMGKQMALYCTEAALGWIRQRDEYVEQQRLRLWKPLRRVDLADWPIGVFGLGVLGRHVAEAFAALGFIVNGYSRSAHAIPGVRSFAESGGEGDFGSFLAATRILVILAPLTSQTRDRFAHAELAQLAANSYVINVARGELLVDDALLSLLNRGHLAGAALDVFRQEPLPADHPFWTHAKISITPHISAMTVIAPSARQVADKIRSLERGEPVSGVVDRARGY
jgi:glyoxylate/hydroxypyruvate reductase